MKMVNVNFQLPKEADEYYRKEAKRRLVSKSAVLRDVLIQHVEKEKSTEKREESIAA